MQYFDNLLEFMTIYGNKSYEQVKILSQKHLILFIIIISNAYHTHSHT